MSIDPYRLLGFAFAAADLLVEVAENGKISFAVGAAEVLAGDDETALIGRSWTGLVDARDQPLISALFDGLEGAARRVLLLKFGTEPRNGNIQRHSLYL